MTPAVPKVSTRTVNVKALIRNPRGTIWSRCGGAASRCVGRQEITVLAECGRTPRRRRGGWGSGPAPKEEGHLRSRAAPRAPTDLATASPVTPSGNIDSRPMRDATLTTLDDLAANVALSRYIRAALGRRYRGPRGHHESSELGAQTIGQDRFGGYRGSTSRCCSGSSKSTRIVGWFRAVTT
jgi:hypothetical protein